MQHQQANGTIQEQNNSKSNAPANEGNQLKRLSKEDIELLKSAHGKETWKRKDAVSNTIWKMNPKRFTGKGKNVKTFLAFAISQGVVVENLGTSSDQRMLRLASSIRSSDMNNQVEEQTTSMNQTENIQSNRVAKRAVLQLEISRKGPK